MFLKIYNIEFDDTTIAFTDQNGRPLEIEDKVNLTLLINKLKSHVILKARTRKCIKEYGFLSLTRKLSKKYRKQLVDNATKTGLVASKTETYKGAHRVFKATGEIERKNIVDKTVTPKPVPEANPGDIE